MPVFGPQGATALAAGYNGQDLAAQLLQKQLQNRGTQMDLQEARRAQLGRMLLEDAVKNVMGRSGEMPMPKAPAQTTKAGEIKVEPVAPMNAEGTTMPGAGGAPATGPAGGGIAPAGAPAASPPGSGTQPGTPEPAQAAAPPSQARKQFTWRDVLQDVMQREDVEPGAKFYAQQEIQKQIDAEDQRTGRLEEKRMAEEARLYRELEVIKTRYEMAGANESEKLRLKSQYDLKLEQLRGLNRENVANIQGQTQRDVAGLRSAAAERINSARLASQEGRAAAQLAYRKDFDAQTLDLKADSQAKNFLLRSRQLDLQEDGMNKKEAQFYAQLEQTLDIAKMRDETTRRGQDTMLQRAREAQEMKLNAEEAKVASAMPAVIDNFDSLTQLAEEMLNHPGMANATGPIQGMLMSFDGDTIAFENLVKTLQSKIGFQALADMRAASPTGGALGNVSNKEVEFLQATVRSLDLRQDAQTFAHNLREIISNASRAKARTLQAYETRFGGKAKGGDVSTAATAPKPGGETRPLPPELSGNPNGTVVKDGKKTFMIQDGKLVETGQ